MALSKFGASGGGLFVEVDQERDALEKELLREEIRYFQTRTRLAEAQIKLAENQAEEAERKAEVLGLEAFLKSHEWERIKRERSTVVAETKNLDGSTTKVTLEDLLQREKIAKAERTIRADVREAAQEKHRQQHRRQDNGQQGRMRPYQGKKQQPDKPKFSNGIKGTEALEEMRKAVDKLPEPPNTPQA